MLKKVRFLHLFPSSSTSFLALLSLPHFTPFLSLLSLLLLLARTSICSAYSTSSLSSSFSVYFFISPLLPSSSPPEGQLNVNALCSMTQLTRMVCDNESASSGKKKGVSKTYQFLSSYQFLSFKTISQTFLIHSPSKDCVQLRISAFQNINVWKMVQ